MTDSAAPRSERTGFAKGDRVEWDDIVDGPVTIPADHGTVSVPNDGGFVWIDSDEPGFNPILYYEDVRHAD